MLDLTQKNLLKRTGSNRFERTHFVKHILLQKSENLVRFFQTLLYMTLLFFLSNSDAGEQIPPNSIVCNFILFYLFQFLCKLFKVFSEPNWYTNQVLKSNLQPIHTYPPDCWKIATLIPITTIVIQKREKDFCRKKCSSTNYFNVIL